MTRFRNFFPRLQHREYRINWLNHERELRMTCNYPTGKRTLDQLISNTVYRVKRDILSIKPHDRQTNLSTMKEGADDDDDGDAKTN